MQETYDQHGDDSIRSLQKQRIDASTFDGKPGMCNKNKLKRDPKHLLMLNLVRHRMSRCVRPRGKETVIKSPEWERPSPWGWGMVSVKIREIMA
jgi:hypothetical protein